MKFISKLPLILLCSILSIHEAESQITINLSDYASVGDVITGGVDTLPSAGILVLGTGSQTWDFTALQINYLDTLNFIDASTTSAVADFPSSNLAYGSDPLYYQTSTASSVTVDGANGSDPFGAGLNVSNINSPVHKLIAFPSTSGSTFTDTSSYATTIETAPLGLPVPNVDSIRMNHVSYITSTIDAYGMVTTPAGTYNSLRQYYVENSIDSIYAYCSDPSGCNVFIAVLPFGWSFVPTAVTQAMVGIANPGLETSYLYKWWATGEDQPVAEVETDVAGGTVINANFKIGSKVIAMIASYTDQLCASTCSGGATAVGISGLTPFTYLWDDASAQTTSIATGLCDTTYTVRIIDAMSDTSYASVTIEAPTAMVGIISTTDDDGSSNGTATLTISGGTSAYSYSWNSIPAQSTPTAINLPSGTYMVTVTDANGCVFVDTAVVPLVPGCNVSSSFNSSATTICAGETINFTNTSSGAVTYNWLENGIVFSSAMDASRIFGTAGSFVISLAADSSGCTDTSSTIITVNSIPTATITASGSTTFCQGDSVTLISTSAATYLWSTSAVSQSLLVTVSGSYFVLVTDGNGCTATSSSMVVTVGTPPSIDSESSTNSSSCGGNDGTITVTASGGTAPLQYSIDGGSNFSGTGAFSSLSTGNYDVVITDAVGCMVVGTTIIITAPGAPTASAGADDAICEGSNYVMSGSFGGTATSSTWSSSGSGSFDNVNLLLATYTPSATDITSGSVILTITSDDPDGAGPCLPATDDMVLTINALAISVAGVDTDICSGETYTISGASVSGVSGLTWTSSGTGSFDNANVLAATYTPSAADIAGGSVMLTLTTDDPTGPCTAASDNMTLTINLAAVTSAGVDDNVCEGNAYSLTGTMGGGATTISWSTSGTGTFSASTSLTSSYTPSAGDLTSGSVTLTITTDDPTGSCLSAADNLILSIVPIPSTPTITKLGSSLSCDQTANSYQWFYDSDTIQGETNQVTGASSDGFYQVAVMDANGCWAVSANFPFTGVEEVLAGLGIEIYPNPSEGEFILEIADVGHETISIRMENYQGQIVYNEQLGKIQGQVKTSVDVRNLSPGLYNVEISIGQKRSVRKLVIR